MFAISLGSGTDGDDDDEEEDTPKKKTKKKTTKDSSPIASSAKDKKSKSKGTAGSRNPVMRAVYSVVKRIRSFLLCNGE